MANYPQSPYYPPPPPPPARIRFDTIGEAWRWFQQQMGVWIGAVLIAGVLYCFVSVVSNLLFTGNLAPFGAPAPAPQTGARVGGWIAAMLITYLVEYGLYAGLFRLALRQIQGAPIAIGDMFQVGSVVLKVLGASLLIGLAVGVGLIFCIIPGLVVMGLSMLTVPLIIDRNMGVMDAINESWNVLKSDWLNATAYHFVIALIAFIGFIACGIGALFTIPLYFLGISSVYRDYYFGAPTPGPMEPFYYSQQQPPPSPPGSANP